MTRCSCPSVPGKPLRPRERLSAAISFLAIATAVLFVGSAFRWIEAIVAILVAAAIATHLTSRRVFTRVPPLVAMLGVAAGLTALQLVPLPQGVIDALQPVGGALRDEGAALVGTSPWQALSLDAPGTLRGLGFFCILLGVAWVALRMSVTESGRYRVLVGIAAVCGVTAVISGLHELVGATSLYGLYAPKQARPGVLGPLLNENHLGCLMAIGVACGMGLATYSRQRSLLRVVWLLQIVACGIVAVASASRGATLALIGGVLMTFGILGAQRLFGTERARSSRPSFMTTSLPVAVVTISAIVVIVYASAGGVSQQLTRTQLDEVEHPNSKFAIWRSATSLVEESPWVGGGRGAFESTITRVHPAAAVNSFSHAENAYVQAVVDWGLPGAVLLGLGAIWIVVAGFRRWRDGPLAAGAIGGIVVVALQSFVDFGVEFLGIALPVTALIATITYVPLREVEQGRRDLARWLRAGHLLVLLMTAIVLVTSATTSNAEDHEALADQKPLRLADLHDALERHPLDYYGYALAAQVMLRERDPRAVSVLNHAMRLHPTHPGLHHMAARLLLRSKHYDQAAIEYAAVVRHTPVLDALLREIVSQLPPAQAARAIPVDLPDVNGIVKLLVELTKSNEIATRWLTRVLEARPGDIRACDLLYSLAIHDKDVAAAEQASGKCTEHGLDPESRVRLSRMLLEAKRYADAARVVRDVETWQGRLDVKVSGWLVACDVLSAQSKWDDAKRCLRRLDLSGHVNAETRAEITTRLDQIEQQRRELLPR